MKIRIKKRVRKISLEKTIWKNRVKKRTNKKLTIATLILVTSFFVLFYCYQSLSPSLQKQFHFNIVGNVINEFAGSEPSVAQVNVNFNDEVGKIREDFYGANTSVITFYL